jgi:hypothetical protein
LAPIFESLRSYFRSPLHQDPVNSRLVRSQIAGCGLRTPALRVEGHDRYAPFAVIRDLLVGKDAAHEPQGYGLLFQPLCTVLRLTYKRVEISGFPEPLAMRLTSSPAKDKGQPQKVEHANGQGSPPARGE